MTVIYGRPAQAIPERFCGACGKPGHNRATCGRPPPTRRPTTTWDETYFRTTEAPLPFPLPPSDVQRELAIEIAAVTA